MEEASIVMVVNKDSKGINIGEMRTLGIITRLNSTHILCITENIINSVIHWVIEQASNTWLILTNVSWITVETFSHLENSRCWSEFCPKILWYFWNGVNSYTIETICGNETSNPTLEFRSDIRITLIKIRQIGKSAIFNLVLIIPIIDLAIRMIMRRLVIWGNLTIVCADGSNVVCNDVYHNPDTHSVGC